MPDLSNATSRSRSRRLGALALALSGVATAAAVTWGHSLATADAARATGMAGGADSDSDGLSDVFESIVGTDLTSFDSDGDGIGDMEEIARQSDPRDGLSLPASDDISIGQSGYVDDGWFRLLTFIYVPYTVTNWNNFKLTMGLKTAAGQVELMPELYTPFTVAHEMEGAQPGTLVVRLETTVPAQLFESLGPFAFFATLTDQPGTGPKTAAAANIEFVAGVFTAIEKSSASVIAPRDYSPSGTSGPSLSMRPMVASDEVPVAFSVGKICVQTTTEVGYSNGVVELLIDSSNCEFADAYCSPNCPFEAGNTKSIVDPLALIGG